MCFLIENGRLKAAVGVVCCAASPVLTAVYCAPLQILQERLKRSDAQDTELLPVLECLTNIAQAFGSRFDIYAKEIYEKATYVLSLHIGAKEEELVRSGMNTRKACCLVDTAWLAELLYI